eukprot:gnl/MRDRNA2_/MRDRNA2_89745_c0_seq1.p1 gnl/MRDRNA2_/MRDRNA2_89745_c0~~gnl/MRDRNA2_/MRDRNA2_89745_c0_seq1.p1  ORF type:complete len:178 (-),score=64.77 gnl/MRDRNA2_/MRDRNA2_89745_c0_seq1:304-837(-)
MADLANLKISEEKKKYIVEELNPLLEELVAEVLGCTPDDPVVHMRDWLRHKKIKRDEAKLSPEERECVMKENERLKQELTRVTETIETIKGKSVQAGSSGQEMEIASDSKAVEADRKQADSDVAAEPAAESLDPNTSEETAAVEPTAKSDSVVVAEQPTESLDAKTSKETDTAQQEV